LVLASSGTVARTMMLGDGLLAAARALVVVDFR
jgi:hypothetical protein